MLLELIEQPRHYWKSQLSRSSGADFGGSSGFEVVQVSSNTSHGSWSTESSNEQSQQLALRTEACRQLIHAAQSTNEAPFGRGVTVRWDVEKEGLLTL